MNFNIAKFVLLKKHADLETNYQAVMFRIITCNMLTQKYYFC